MKAIGRIIQVLIWIALGLLPTVASALMVYHSEWTGSLASTSALIMGCASGVLMLWYAPEKAKQFYKWYKQSLKQDF